MLDNAFKIAIDPIFPPADLNFKRGSTSITLNQFRLIFDEAQEQCHFAQKVTDQPIRDCLHCSTIFAHNKQNKLKEQSREESDSIEKVEND